MTHDERYERRQQIAAWVYHGASFVDAAKQFGVGVSTVKIACAQSGIPRPKLEKKNIGQDIVLRILAKLISSDGTFFAIGASFNVSRQYVQQVHGRAAKAGISIRPHPKGRPRTLKDYQI